jgi:MSHA biogenesis protein MshI
MRFFSKRKNPDRLLAVAFSADGILAASVRRMPEGLPQVKLARFVSADKPRTPEGIQKFSREVHASQYTCLAVLGQGEYQFLSVEAPAVPAEELKVAIRWRLKDMIDFPVDMATVDVLSIPADKAAAGRPSPTFAVAARNTVIQACQDLFVGAKLPLAVIDIPEMAQRNVSALLEPEGRGLAMLSFGADGGLLTVSYNQELFLSRRIDVNLEHLLEPDHDRKHAYFDRIALELQRSLDHFERQYSYISVSRLVLAPTGAAGLDEYLSSNLYTKVETLDLASVFDLSAVPELAEAAAQQRYFNVLGAALRKEETAA